MNPNVAAIIEVNGDIVEVPIDRLDAALKAAFDTGAYQAIAALSIKDPDEIAAIECDKPEVGATFLRVTVRHVDGRAASAVGAIPDPRAQ